MSEMVNRAMDKIRDEMAGTKDRNVPLIGEIMTELLLMMPEESEKILAEGKSLQGTQKHCMAYAARIRKNGERMLETSPEEDAQCISEYWGIEQEKVETAMLALNTRKMMQRFGGKLPEGISFIGAETQAHAENPSGASRHLPYRGEAVMGAGENTGSLLDDFDALLGGL